MKRVLQVIGQLGRGGDTTVVLDVMRQMNPDKYVFDFLTHDKADIQVVEQLRKEGYVVHVLNGDVRKLGPAKYYREIRKIIKNAPYTYDAIHTHTSMQSGVALMAAKHAGIKTRICHSHVSAIQRKTSSINKIVCTPFLRYLYMHYATVKVGCSKMAGNFLFGKDNQYQLIYNGVDTKEYSDISAEEVERIRAELKIGEQDIVIGHVARFSKMKNQKFDLAVARKLSDRPDIKFVLVGKGADFDEITESAKTLGNKIIITGQRNDVSVLMKSFDCVILPSLPGEGFPVTIMEAEAAGCKCIISDKVTSEVEVGLNLVKVLPVSDMESWCDELRSVKRNSDIGKRNQCAFELEKKGFGKNEFVRKWLSLYE